MMSGDRAQGCDTQSLRSALIEAIHTATRRHGLAPTGTDHCLCGGWVEGDDWDEHLAPVSLDAILPLIADAIEAEQVGIPRTNKAFWRGTNAGIRWAGALVRLLGTDSPATVSLPSSSPALPETGE